VKAIDLYGGNLIWKKVAHLVNTVTLGNMLD